MLFSRLVGSGRSAWATLIVGLIVIAGIFAVPAQESTTTTVGGLSGKYQSTQVQELLDQFPEARQSTALAVVSRTDGRPLTAADQTAMQELKSVAAAAGSTPPPAMVPPIVSENGLVGLVPLTLQSATDDGDGIGTEVAAMRAAFADAAPDGLTVQLTGGAAFQADLADVFSGADFTLLLVTAVVVAVLLLITYRSPWLWMVPLAVVGAIEQLAAKAVDLLAPVTGIAVDPSAAGITSVLVFGAATNYALLLIARYREELRRRASVYEAMQEALRRTTGPIVASGGTVILALLTLLLTDTLSYRGLGFSAALGVLLAILSALILLPAALVLLGRRLFWPFVPRVGDAGREGRFWGRLGGATARRPKIVAGTAVVVLLAMAGGLFSVQIGLSENEQFRTKPQAVTAAETLATGFPAGRTSPVIVTVDAGQTEQALAIVRGTEGVSSAAAAGTHDGAARIDAVTDFEAGTAASNRFVQDLRAELALAPELGAAVGGEAAERVDHMAANERDSAVVISLVIVLVLTVLIFLLRALLAPVLLVASVILTFGASTGLGWLLFHRVLGFPALDVQTLLYSFIFLVALGVDYNIFLVSRARENAAALGTRAGMLAALRSTGGVITSAGILLAAVFVVLGVLPLVTLTQVGTTVAIGVLLDTLVVRTVVVPALAFILGERFWWPGRPRAHKHVQAPEPARV